MEKCHSIIGIQNDIVINQGIVAGIFKVEAIIVQACSHIFYGGVSRIPEKDTIIVFRKNKIFNRNIVAQNAINSACICGAIKDIIRGANVIIDRLTIYGISGINTIIKMRKFIATCNKIIGIVGHIVIPQSAVGTIGNCDSLVGI